MLKIDSLSSDTPSSPSSFMTCPSFQGFIAHNVSLQTIFMAFCCCTSPQTFVQILAVDHANDERKKIGPPKQGQSLFLRMQLSTFMTIISVHADDLGLQTSASTHSYSNVYLM